MNKVQNFILIELGRWFLIWADRKIFPVFSFILLDLLCRTAAYTIPIMPVMEYRVVISVYKVPCKECRHSLGGQPRRHSAAATLHQLSCLVLVWVAAMPCYMQQTAPSAKACVVTPVYSLLLFSCFGGETGMSQFCFSASKIKIRRSIIMLSI